MEGLSGIVGGKRMGAEQEPEVMEPSQQTQTTDTDPANQGAAMMRQAADEVLKDKCMDIAFALANSSMEGHIQSSKFLYDLAVGNQKLGPVEVARQLDSLATRLESEPQWPAALSEDTAETWMGGREPEG